MKGFLWITLSSLALPLQAETEPNNTAAEATPVTIGQEWEFQFLEKGDRDYFSLKAPGDGVLRLRLTQKASSHQVFPWWGETEGEDGRSDLRRNGFWDRRVSQGEAVILALKSHRWPHMEAASPDLLKALLEWVPPVDTEPNDDATTALPATVNQPLLFSLNPTRDVDYFTLEAPGDGVLRFFLSQKSKDHEPYPWWGEFVGPDGKTYERRSGIWDLGVTEGQQVTFALRGNRWPHQEKGSAEKLEGFFRFQPYQDAEPNNSPETATPAQVGQELSFQFNPQHDRDYFVIESPGTGTLRFEVTQDARPHEIYPWWGERTDSNGQTYLHRGGEWDTQAEKGERVIFGLKSSRWNHRERSSSDVMKGRFSFSQRLDQEPNDRAEDATPIEVGQPFRFQLTPRGDRDYFTFVSPGRGSVELSLPARPLRAARIYPWWGEEEREGQLYELRSGKWDRSVDAGETVVFALRSDQFAHSGIAIEEALTGLVAFTPEEGSEPNDLPEQAERIALDVPFPIVLNPEGDRDCFRVTAPGPGALRFLRQDQSPVHPGLFSAWIHADTAYPGSRETRAKKGEEAVLQLRSHRFPSSEQASDIAISGLVEFLPEPNAPETGEDPSDATEVRLGEPFSFAILPRWDRDHFRFTPEKDGFVSLRLLSPAVENQVLSHWWLGSAEGPPVENQVFPVQAGKTHFLGLAADRQTWSSQQVYRAVIEASPAPPLLNRRWTFEIERLTP
ncbi:MAG: hypothetical protein AAF555_07200 [Verrucomicrobiota bacterium]